MKWLYKPRSEFINNVIVLMTGSVIAQIIPLLTIPILTRMYTPEQFGSFAIFLSALSILTVIATARYETAIMLPKSKSTAKSIVLLSLCITVILSVSFFLLTHFFKDYINNWFSLNVAYLIPFAIISAGTIQTLRMWLNRNKSYKILAINRVEQSLIGACTQIGFGIFNFGSIGLILGQLAGEAAACLKLLKKLNVNSLFAFNRTTIKRAVISFKRYLYLLKFGVPALLTSRAAQESLLLLVGLFMNPLIAGYTSLLNRLIAVPSSVLSANLGDVFYQKITETKKCQSYPIVLNFIIKLFLFSVPVFSIFYITLSISFTPIFGSGWSDALAILPYLAVVAAMSFVFSPITVLFNYYEVQGWNLIWQSSWLVSNIICFYTYSYFDLSISEFFLIYMIKQIFLYLIGIFCFLLYSRSLYEN